MMGLTMPVWHKPLTAQCRSYKVKCFYISLTAQILQMNKQEQNQAM